MIEDDLKTTPEQDASASQDLANGGLAMPSATPIPMPHNPTAVNTSA